MHANRLGLPLRRLCARCGGELLCGVLLAALLLLGVQPPAAQAQTPSPTFDLNAVAPPSAPPLALAGESIYEENCAPCHGPQGLGDGPTAESLPGPPAVFADPEVVWTKSPAELFHTTKYGRLEMLMPPWQNQLSDEQIWQTVAYVWTLHTDAVEAAQGADLYRLACASCHGETGAGDGPEAEGELPDWSDPAAAMTRSGADWLAGWESAHPDIGREWTLAEQRSVLEAIRTFSYVPTWQNPYRPGTGVISGQVSQGTPGATSPEGAEVRLEAFVNFAPVAAFTTTVDADGRFVFEGLDAGPDVVYMASVPVDDLTFASPILAFSPQQGEIETAVTVYEPTEDASGITIDRFHWIVDSQPGALIVGQVAAFGSSGDRAYIGQALEGLEERATVALYVPDDATDLRFDNGALGERFQRVGNWVYDTLPLVPGDATKQIIMRYVLPYAEDRAALEQELRYPVQEMNLLIGDLPDLEVDITGELTDMGSQQFQERVYRIWQGQELEPANLRVALSGLLPPGADDPRAAAAGGAGAAPMTAAVLPQASWTPWVWSAMLLCVLAGALLWAWKAGRIGVDAAEGALSSQREELLNRIAQLDDLRAAGGLSDEAWRRQRSEEKVRLIEVSRRLEAAAH